MKRILFFVSSMEGGGAERVAASLCNYWSSKGYEVTLVATFSERGDCAYELESGVKLLFLTDLIGKRGMGQGWAARLRRIVAIRRLIRRMAPDAVLSFLPNVNIAVLIACVGLPIPVVVSERSYPPLMPVPRWLAMLRRYLYPRAKCVVVQTEKALEWLNKSSPTAVGVVIANPVVLPLCSSQPIVAPDSVLPPERRVVLAAGRLAQEKGFGSLIEAFANVSECFPDWDVVILGDGPLKCSLHALRATHALDERVYFPGRVGNMSDWYLRSEMFVLASDFEGFPNVLLEAMAHGLPVISTDCLAGPGDIVRHGVDGLLVQHQGKVEGLSRSLNTVLIDDALRKKMSSCATEVRSRFCLHAIAEAWETVLGLRA